MSNGYASTLFTPSAAITSTLPWFDYESYRSAFEELLIGTVFSVSLWPAMILFFILTGICLLIYVCSLWAPADGDDRECCSSPGTCCLHTYRLLGRWRFFSRGRTGPWPYSGRSKEVVPEVIAYNAKGEELQRKGTEEVTRRGPPQRTTQVKNEDGSITTTTDYASPFVQVHNCEEDSPEFSGYMSLVFILFALAAVSYTGLYLRSYDPSKPNETTSDQNVFRTRNDYQRSSSLEPEVAQGMEALLGNSFDLSFALVGSAAAATCDSTLVQSFEWSGCTYPNPLTSGQPLACSNLLATASYAKEDGMGTTDASSCQLTLHFPIGTTYLSLSTITLSLSPDIPSASLFQSLRLRMVQNATTIALNLPQTGTAGSSVNAENTAAIAGYTWSETLFRRDSIANAATSLPLANVNRRWTITPVAYRTQRTSSWVDVFDSVWYSSVSDVDSPILATVAPASFYSSSSSTSSGFCPSSSSGLQISIALTISSSFTVNQTQRFLGDHSVVLTMILGVVAIFQLISFVETLFKIGYHACCYRVHKGLITAAQSTGATGPTANNGGIGQDDDSWRGIRGTFGAGAPVPASNVHRWQVPPDDFVNPNQPMYGPAPVFGGYPTDAGWAGFEPSLHPLHNPGPGYPPPRVMPLTPSSPLPYLRGPLPPPQQRRGDFIPYSQRTPVRERFDDPRIAAEVELSQRQQRGGFEM